MSGPPESYLHQTKSFNHFAIASHKTFQCHQNGNNLQSGKVLIPWSQLRLHFKVDLALRYLLAPGPFPVCTTVGYLQLLTPC